MTKNAKNEESRRGPSPLPVHITLAMAEYTRLQQAGKTSQKDLELMLAGIKKYQSHPYKRSMEPLPVIWRDGEVSLIYCAAKEPQTSLLLVPSMINKSHILDLLPQKSFVRWLAKQGVNTYLLDWGTPVNDAGLCSMDGAISEKLYAVLNAAAEHSGDKIHALGYCMGGTFLAAALLHNSNSVKSAVFLASPWDFAAGDKKLADQVKMGTVSALQMIEKENYLPKDWIQSVFAAVNASKALRKFSEFAAREDEHDKEELFVAVEDWLNEGVDLPKDLARTCIIDWYGKNKPGRGEWEVGGRHMDLRQMELPCLVVASLNDRLVPKESSLAMMDIVPDAQLLEPSSGHIGMMTGRKAEEQVWMPVAGWVKEHA